MKALNPMDIDRYITMAEENFSGADGMEDYDNFLSDVDLGASGDNGIYYGGDGIYYGAEGDDYSYAAAAAARPVPAKQPTPYMVNITNTTPNPLNVVLFGLNVYLLTPNFGTSTGVLVAPAQANITYLQLLQQSASQPFETSLIRVQSANSSQVTQIITVTSKDANGQECKIPVITQSYFSANQFQPGIVDVPFNVKIDGNTYMEFTILGNTTATITLFPSTKVNNARELMGASNIQQYSAPAVPVAVPMFTARPVGIRPPKKLVKPTRR